MLGFAIGVVVGLVIGVAVTWIGMMVHLMSRAELLREEFSP